MPHLLSYLRLLFFGMLMWHLPSLPYIYSSLFTYLRHICKEKICANPFFAPNAYFSWLWLSWKRGHDTFSCHQLYIYSWTLGNFLTRDTIQANLFGDHTILLWNVVANSDTAVFNWLVNQPIVRSCFFDHVGRGCKSINQSINQSMWLVHGLFSLAKLTKITEDANFVSCSEKVQRIMAILADF